MTKAQHDFQPLLDARAWRKISHSIWAPRMKHKLFIAIFSALLLTAATPVLCALTIDGRIDEAEWQSAKHITDFRMVLPLSKVATPYPTEAWVLSTPDGLAIAFRNTQTAETARTRQRSQRDNNGPVDRVNAYIDFDGDNRAGYNFTVTLSNDIADSTFSNENQFNGDWDGNWKHATFEDGDTWSAEMLIPWHIAPMQKVAGDTRTLRLSLDRVVGSRNERMAWPAITWTEQRFLSNLEPLQLKKYNQSLLAITPFVVAVQDQVAGEAAFDGGADIFWKPNGQFQLSATLNPDFGQVESDQLVVNFSAVESFFSDKRPFFTENQSFFDVPFGSLNNGSRLIYTRRVGGRADDGNGAGDVTAAVKLNGSFGATNYGVFAATEADEAGRDFFAARATRDFGNQGLGVMITQVDRPYLDRLATVYSFDHRWSPGAAWNVRTTALASDVSQAGNTVRDSGAQIRIDHESGNGWRQQLYVLHSGGDLQLNDFGYLERNNFNYIRGEIARRVTKLPESSPYSSHDYQMAVSNLTNDDGVLIRNAWALKRYSNRRDGGNQLLDIAIISAGHDDLITRGNGIVNMPAKLFIFAERFIPHKDGKKWDLYGNVRYAAEGLDGPSKGLKQISIEPTYLVNEKLSLNTSLFWQNNPDWLLWQGNNKLGTFNSSILQLGAGVTWLINNKQELRVRLEALGLDAEAKQAWRVQPDGTPLAVNETLDDFGLNNLGFQIRYRYELAPLSYLYIAYVRGGSLFEDGDIYSSGQLLGDAFSLRDSEQLLVKFSYRFEL